MKKLSERKSYVLGAFCLFYVLGIFFFFSSNYWMPQSDGGVVATKIGKTYVFSDRDITLERWQFSEEQQIMEIELKILNHSTDSIQHLFYAAVDQSKKEVPVTVIYEENGMVVLRMEDLPQNWKAISFRIKLTADSEDVLKLYTNRDAVEKVAKIQDKSEVEYFVQREENNIREYEDQIQEIEDEIQRLLEQIDNVNNNINNLYSSKKYQTEEEQLQTDKAIQELEDSIVSYQESVAEYDSEKRNLESKILQSQQLIEDYKEE